MSFKFPFPRHLGERGWGAGYRKDGNQAKTKHVIMKNYLNLRKRNVLKLQLTNGFRSFRRKGGISIFNSLLQNDVSCMSICRSNVRKTAEPIKPAFLLQLTNDIFLWVQDQIFLFLIFFLTAKKWFREAQ